MAITTKSGVYLLTNLINGKIYVGKSVNLQNRMSGHRNSNQTLIDKAIQKYGWNNFKVSILECFDKVDNQILLNKESEWIKKLNSTDLSIGYNVLSYGTDRTGIRMPEEQKLRHSACMKGKFSGENHPMFGKKHSPESIKLMSASHKLTARKGKAHPFFGKPRPSESIAKVKLAMSLGSHDSLKRKVNQIDLESGKLIKTWESLAEAARHFNCSYNQISQVCVGYVTKAGHKCKSAKGYGWSFP